MPFLLRDIRKKFSQHVRACAAGDGAICSKNRKIVPYHGANSNTRNGARLRSPSPIMAPVIILFTSHLTNDLHNLMISYKKRSLDAQTKLKQLKISHNNSTFNKWQCFYYFHTTAIKIYHVNKLNIIFLPIYEVKEFFSLAY